MIIHLLFLLILLKFVNKRNEESGPLIGTNLIGLSYFDDNKLTNFIDFTILKHKKIMLIVDSECSGCSGLMEKMSYLKQDTTENILVFHMLREDVDDSKEDALKNRIYLSPNVIVDKLNIKGFPYLIKFNEEGLITQKSYASIDVFLQYITNERIE